VLVRELVPNLDRTRFFHPLRNAYLRICKPRYWEDYVVGPKRFYGQFVERDSLVFDIGANTGDYVRSFLSLGAGKVIAVEPTPHLVDKLRCIRDKRLTVIPCAVGKEPGILQLHISNFDTLNSISEGWINKVADEVNGKLPQWIQTVNVEAVTLDSLIARYGRPDFIKIDVEGYELEVLQGLTEAPKYLAFEFHSETIDTSLRCLRQPCFSKQARFNYIIGEPYGRAALALPGWVTAEQMNEIAGTKLAAGRIFGDIFVHCR